MQILAKKRETGLEFVRSRVDPDGQSAERKAFEEQWFASVGLFAGIKFVAAAGTVRQFRSYSQQQETYNAPLILPMVLRYLAKLRSINPKAVVLPMSDEWEDMQAARLALKAHEHAVEVTRFKARRARSLRWAAVCGSGFLKVCFDPTRGVPDRIYVDEDGRATWAPRADPKLRAQYEQAGLFRDVFPGEIDCQVVEPWQVWPDPNARDGGIDDCEWVNIRTVRTIGSIFNETGVRVSPDSDALRGAELYREAIAFMAAGQTGTAPAVRRARIDPCVYQDEMFVRPSRDYPKGRYIRIAGTEILEDRDNPYVASGSPIPLVKYDCFPCPGRFWGLSLVELLRGSNRAYQASRGHAMNMQARNGFAPTFIDKGSGISPVNIKGLHGLLLEINPNTRPPFIGQPPTLPEYILRNAETARLEMQQISAQTDPSTSKLPGQLRSGDAIRAVQADSNLILTESVESMFEADENAGRMMLQLIGMHYDGARLLQVFGPGSEIDPVYLKGADLRGHYRLKLVVQPGDIDSAESRDAKIMDAAQLKILNPENPEHQMLMLRALRFHSSDDYVNALLGQESSEERAIATIIDSGGEEMPQVAPWFDPMVRSKVLERRLNSRAFELYSPQIQQALAARWMQFSMMIQKQMEAQLQAAAAIKGSPGAKGEASQPSR